MELEKNKEPEKKQENNQDKEETWIDKTEAFIDDAADKIHKSNTYKKADKGLENATKSIFRSAGKLWGKSERYFKNSDDKKDTQ